MKKKHLQPVWKKLSDQERMEMITLLVQMLLRQLAQEEKEGEHER